jgi:hypothetical protein
VSCCVQCVSFICGLYSVYALCMSPVLGGPVWVFWLVFPLHPCGMGVLCLSYSLHPLGVDVRGSFPDGCDSVSFSVPPGWWCFCPMVCGGSRGSPPFLHGGLGVFLPTRFYGVGYSPGWVSSCYLSPIPFALRVFPRLVICMAHGVWGRRGSPPPTYMGWVRSVFLTRMCYWT